MGFISDFFGSVFFPTFQEVRLRREQHADRMSVQRDGLELQRRRVDAYERRIEIQEDSQRKRALAAAEVAKHQERLDRLQEEHLRIDKERLALEKQLHADELARFEQERVDRLNAAYESYSQQISLDFWPVRIEPRDLRTPILVDGAPPVIVLVRNHGAFDEGSYERIERKLRQDVEPCFSGNRVRHRVRLYWNDIWKTDAISADAAARMLVKHTLTNPCAILELRRFEDTLVLDTAIWGLDPLWPMDPIVRSSAATISGLGLGAPTSPEAERRVVAGLTLSLVGLIDACAMHRFGHMPVGPEILPAILARHLSERGLLDAVEHMRLRYNEIAEIDPSLTNDVKLYLGYTLARSGQHVAALSQAYELLDAWHPDPKQICGPEENGMPSRFRVDDGTAEGLAALLEGLDQDKEADRIRATMINTDEEPEPPAGGLRGIRIR